MRRRVKNFLRKVEEAGLHIMITETWRSKERQEWLYAQGRTRPGAVVTWTLQSKHRDGLAIDIAFVKDGKVTYEGDWQNLGVLGEAVGLNWGGRFPQIPDKPHFELNGAWQEEHWAAVYEKRLIDHGIVQYKKDLSEHVTRGELYAILNKLHNLQ